MKSFMRWTLDRMASGFNKGINFISLVQFTGDNIEDISRAIKKANIGNINVLTSDIAKRKPNTEFIKLIRGSDYQYFYLQKNDWVGCKKNEVFVFSQEYVKQYFKVIDNQFVPKEAKEDTGVASSKNLEPSRSSKNTGKKGMNNK